MHFLNPVVPIKLSATAHEPLYSLPAMNKEYSKEGRPNSKKLKAKRKAQKRARRLSR